MLECRTRGGSLYPEQELHHSAFSFCVESTHLINHNHILIIHETLDNQLH
jgi:hypothetical protein